MVLLSALPRIVTATEWRIQTVDSVGEVGLDTSLALGSNGYPHISYFDQDNGDLNYAYWNGSEWQIQTVDSEEWVGWYTSLALDSNEFPHISYLDYTNRDLKYAYWDGANWQIQTVDSEGIVGYYSSLALDKDDHPHISYYDQSNSDLKYACWDGAEWQIQTVDSEWTAGHYTSLALDCYDYPHISYLYYYKGNYLKYAYWNGSEWQIQTVDSTGDVGDENTSLALSSNNYPHISYFSYYGDGHLKYAYWNGSEWQIQTVDSAGDVGKWTSLALDSYDYPHISYCDSSNGDLKYAHWDGTNWQRQIVDSAGDVGDHTSLALDSYDYPHISYYDDTNSNLKYATSAPPIDITPPAAIIDLASSNPTPNSITLTWTAPGDDGDVGTASQYDIRYSTSMITEDSWDTATQCQGEPAPQTAGEPETFVVTDLSPSTTYYFAIKTADEVPNWSSLSNVAQGTTKVPPDTTPPAAVMDLATSNPTDTQITLTWTAPGDDGNAGTANQYDIRYSTSLIDEGNFSSATQCQGEPSPKAAGSTETFTVTGLSPDTTYYFAIKTADEVPNWSLLSNIAQGTTLSGGEQISGIITDGVNPIPATVQAWQDGTMVKEVDTPDGYYVISGLQTGTYAIRAYSDGYYAAVLDEITPPATNIDLSLTQAPNVTNTTKVCDFWCQDNTKMDWKTQHIPVLVQIGDVITARDADGIICGIATVGEFGTDEGDYFIHVYGDDATTPGVDEGAVEGDTIKFFINGYPASVTFGTPQWHSGGSFEVCLSATITKLGDVSGNGQITAYDAALILQHVVSLRKLSTLEQERADVTGDETISALDAALILQYTVGLITSFPGDSPPIAPSLNPKTETKLLAEAIKQLESIPLTKEPKKILEQLKSLISACDALHDAFYQQLLPKHTGLLQNYPNPFNPETWIPFELASSAEVIIRIYNTKGQLVRTLHLGNQNAGIYVTKDKAAYWDGTDSAGEKVASGVYFYTLQAGEFRATRKMIIMK